ncbi:hypothetical protein BJ165DRAFT_1414095 [Panaeolus papilionaceus]|nr:hypothetical protein BJ165DRAFT_1414095 [Panaeolus papilionaceus]
MVVDDCVNGNGLDTDTDNTIQFQFSSTKDQRQQVHLPPEIWLEIFQFATYVHASSSMKPLDPFRPRRAVTNAMGANSYAISMKTKRSLVLVSHWWRHLALPILYEHIVVRSPSRATKIVRVLEDSRRISDSSSLSQTESVQLGYGEWTRHIEIYTYARGSEDIEYLKKVFRVMRCCPNLRFLSGIWIHQLPREFLAVITQLYTSSNLFTGIYWNDVNPKNISDTFCTLSSPEFLASFQSLRILDLRHFVGEDPALRDPLLSSPTLPHVQDLILSTYPRSLQAATILNLPSLRNLTLRTPDWRPGHELLLNDFLRRHGPSLVTVDLLSPSPDNEPEPDTTLSRRTATHPDVCPNLATLIFPVTSPQLTSSSHPNLRRIGLRGVRPDGLFPEKPSSTKDHLMAITSDKYPSIELVQTISFLVEFDGDSFSKDRFEADGIDFRDGEGPVEQLKTPEKEEKAEQQANVDKKAEEAPVQRASVPVTDTLASTATAETEADRDREDSDL